MTITRAIDHHLLQLSDVAASGDITEADALINDLGLTLFALVAAKQERERYPAGTVIGGVGVGGQFKPGDGGTKGSGSAPKDRDSGSQPDDADDLYEKIMDSMSIESAKAPIAGSPLFFIAYFLAVSIAVAGGKALAKFIGQAAKKIADAHEDSSDFDDIKPDWPTSERKKGDQVLAESGLKTSVDDLAKAMYVHKDDGLASELVSIPRRKSAINLLKRRDEIGSLQAELDKETNEAKRETIGRQIEWRVGMIKAEERFGKNVNESYLQDDGAYNSLIENLKRNSSDKKSNPPKLYKKRLLASNSTINALKAFGFQLEEVNSAWASDIETFAAEFDQMTDMDLSTVEIGHLKSRNRSEAIRIAKSGFVNIGGLMDGYVEPATKAFRAVTYHEIAHEIEAGKDTWETSAQFIKDRDKESGNKGLRSMRDYNPAYGADEKTYPDKFIDPYVGIIYEKAPIMNGNTEVVSMGVQKLAGPNSLADMAIKDREHLMYALSVISKK